MIILTAARPFPRLSTAPIIVWTVNEGSIPMIESITLVKGDAALRVDVLIVRIMCVALALPSIAVCVTANFTAVHANVIMKSVPNVNLSNVVASVKPNTRSSATNVISAGTPNVLCVRNGYLSKIISVTFNPW